jgi:hypothetical protein
VSELFYGPLVKIIIPVIAFLVSFSTFAGAQRTLQGDYELQNQSPDSGCPGKIRVVIREANKQIELWGWDKNSEQPRVLKAYSAARPRFESEDDVDIVPRHIGTKIFNRKVVDFSTGITIVGYVSDKEVLKLGFFNRDNLYWKNRTRVNGVITIEQADSKSCKYKRLQTK